MGWQRGHILLRYNVFTKIEKKNAVHVLSLQERRQEKYMDEIEDKIAYLLHQSKPKENEEEKGMLVVRIKNGERIERQGDRQFYEK